MTYRPPLLIGVAGGSCSGKTHFCGALSDALRDRGQQVTTVSLDSFYLDRSGIPEEERWQLNFDHPDALDWPAITCFFTKLREGQPVTRPSYDFASHSRAAEWTEVPPAPIVLVEGLYALSPRLAGDEDANPYALSLFVDCFESLALYRRLRRDEASRGRDEAQTLRQFYGHVLPMYQQHILPTRQHADFTIQWSQTQPRLLAHLTTLIARLKG